MRRRLLSQSGLKLSRGMTINIKKYSGHSLTGTMRVKLATTSGGVASSNTYIDCTILNGNTATASISIGVDVLTDKLTELGLKKSDTFYYGLFPTTSKQGVIVAGISDTLIKQQYNSQTVSTLYESGDDISVNWYNSRITMEAIGSPMKYYASSVQVYVRFSYANWTVPSISNKSGFTLRGEFTSGLDGGSLIDTGLTRYTVDADINTSRNEKTTTFSITTNSLLSDAVVNNSVGIRQLTEPLEYSIYYSNLLMWDYANFSQYMYVSSSCSYQIYEGKFSSINATHVENGTLSTSGGAISYGGGSYPDGNLYNHLIIELCNNFPSAVGELGNISGQFASEKWEKYIFNNRELGMTYYPNGMYSDVAQGNITLNISNNSILLGQPIINIKCEQYGLSSVPKPYLKITYTDTYGAQHILHLLFYFDANN